MTMLSEEVMECVRRRERLLARVDRQRESIAAELERWEQPMKVVERGVSVARYLKAHPLFVVIAVVTAAVAGRRNLARWAGTGLVAWRTWRSFRGWVGRFGI